MLAIKEETQNLIQANKNQSESIKTLSGAVMVLAGPGTGKTFTVIQRIKYMLETGITPEEILCLTYSETAANEMKTRLVKEMGTKASALTIHTYHAFCNEIIKQYPAEFELLDGVTLVDDIEKHTLMKHSLIEFNPTYYRTKWGDAEYFIPELIVAVDQIKKNRIDKLTYFKNIETNPIWQIKMDEMEAEYLEREKKGKLVKSFLSDYEGQKRKIGKAKEAWGIYELYNEKLKRNNFIDFNDMINMVLEVFDTNKNLLKRVASRYNYFLVDEYQDTNYAQNNIVFKLAEGNNSSNIFVVGDDDQIIYEFQGAKKDTLEKFLNKYPETKVICLTENNRSTQNILDISYEIIKQDETRLEFNSELKKYNINKRLTAKNSLINSKNKKIQIDGFGDLKQEDNFITDSIEKLIQSSDCPKNEYGETDLSQIAVIVRENAEAETFAELFKSKNIMFQIKLSKSIFELKSSILTYFYAKALFNQELYSDKLFGLLGSEPFAFAPQDYKFLLEQNRLNHKDFIYNIKNNLDYEWANKERVTNFIEVYDRIKLQQSDMDIKNLIVEIINSTGILEHYLKSDINRIENTLALKRITDEAASYSEKYGTASLSDFLEHLDKACLLGIPLSIDKDEYIQNAIQIITFHSAKGREFEYVYIPHLISKNWEKRKGSSNTSLPLTGSDTDYDENSSRTSEQLRLLFVGVTRAKHFLNLTYSNTIDGKPQELTSYLTGLTSREDLCRFCMHELAREDYIFEAGKFMTKTNYDYKSAFKDELNARLKDFILSPSALNTYNSCARKFLYQYLLKIPTYQKEWGAANYGNAVHRTLELSVKSLKESGSYPKIDEFITCFKKCLSAEKFNDISEREIYEKRGERSLNNYYPIFISTTLGRIYATEYNFNHIPADKYFIKGFIDRIEQNEDGTFCIYDYKTGSAKPKSQIADGKKFEDYLNQLRFYKLAFETQNPKSKVSYCGLIFVEEPNGNFVTELTYEDNEYIKDKIVTSYEKINNLDFTPCEKDCQDCPYKQLCKLDII